MRFYALRTTSTGKELHAFPDQDARDHWTDAHHAPPGTVGHRESITSRHQRVREVYRETNVPIIHHGRIIQKMKNA